MTNKHVERQAGALAKWPDVPACYGWLSLDRRGRWRLKDETISHPGLMSFLNLNYASDERGNWFVQNGPQRVYVALDYLPFVVRLAHDGSLELHTAQPAGSIHSVHMDEEGSVLMLTDAGPALLDDRDLNLFFDHCLGPAGARATEHDLHAAMSGGAALTWNGIKIESITRAAVPTTFGVIPDPAA